MPEGWVICMVNNMAWLNPTKSEQLWIPDPSTNLRIENFASLVLNVVELFCLDTVLNLRVLLARSTTSVQLYLVHLLKPVPGSEDPTCSNSCLTHSC